MKKSLPISCSAIALAAMAMVFATNPPLFTNLLVRTHTVKVNEEPTLSQQVATLVQKYKDLITYKGQGDAINQADTGPKLKIEYDAITPYIDLLGLTSNDKLLEEFKNLADKILSRKELLSGEAKDAENQRKGAEVDLNNAVAKIDTAEADLKRAETESDKVKAELDKAKAALDKAEAEKAKIAAQEKINKQGETFKTKSSELAEVEKILLLLSEKFFKDRISRENQTLENFQLDEKAALVTGNAKALLHKITAVLNGLTKPTAPSEGLYKNLKPEAVEGFADEIINATTFVANYQILLILANDAAKNHFQDFKYDEGNLKKERELLETQKNIAIKDLNVSAGIWLVNLDSHFSASAKDLDDKVKHFSNYDASTMEKILAAEDKFSKATIRLQEAFLAVGVKEANLDLKHFDSYKQQILVATDWYEGSSEDTILDQVRLFYYPNPLAIAYSLRPREDFFEANPATASTQKEAQLKRTDLKKLEANILALAHQRNELQSRVETIKADINSLTTQINNHQRQIDAKQTLINGYSKQIEIKNARISKIDTRLSETTNPPSEAEKTQLNQEKDRLNQDIAKLNEQSTFETSQRDNFVGEQTSYKTNRSKLVDEQSGQPSQLAAAQTSLNDAIQQLRSQRLQLPTVAEDEANAFGSYVLNEPVLMALGSRGMGSSARRVRFIVYPRSKVIVLRGPKVDVNRVKDIIALFDRPAPQARITLHSLQINGASNQALGQAMAQISDSLRDAKANMMIVQDTLRNAITAEVGRCQRSAELYAKPKSGQSNNGLGAFFRGQVYSREVQQALGMQSLNSEWWQIGRIMVELQDLSKTIGEAATELQAASDYEIALKKVHGATDSNNRPLSTGQTLAEGPTEDMDGRELQASLSKKQRLRRQDESDIKALEAAHAKAATRFRLIATRAAYLASNILDRINSNTTLKEDLDKILKSCPGKAFKSVFDECYQIVRGSNKSIQEVISQLSCAYVNHHASNIDNYRRIDTNGTPRLKIEALTHNLNRSLQRVYSELEGRIDMRTHDDIGREHSGKYSLTIPDPAKVTTLGEMLFVMSLTNRASRERILHDFAEQLYFDCKINSARAKEDDKEPIKKKKEKEEKRRKGMDSDLARFAVATITQFGNQAHNQEEFINAGDFAPYPLFPRSVFGANPFSGAGADSSWSVATNIATKAGVDDDEVSSNQLEILYGLRAKIRRNIASELRRYEFNKSPVDFNKKPIKHWPSQESIVAFAKQLLEINQAVDIPLPDLAKQLDESESLSTATPRVAAADQMIKRFMETFETDFDKFFISPMLEHIRTKIATEGVQFGSYERKSVLASNRLLARIDSFGTANVQIGDQQDILSESATLLSILDSVKNAKAPATAQSTTNMIGSALGDGTVVAGIANATGNNLAGNTLLKYGAIGALLSSLLSQPAQARGEIYSIGTGGAFKVVPIFNPSGQGLTFRLDYAQATTVMEPDGTTQLQAPRIERQTTNTEVQISNLDLDQVVSFENNFQLGRAESKAGGVPILRDIFPTVPIIGWFTRSPKVSPIRQNSLIFAQTAMYPTVGDIMDLLVQNPSGSRYQSSGAPDTSNPKDKNSDN